MDRPDSRHTVHVADRENAAATQVPLSSDELTDLDTLAQRIGVHGARYNETHLGYVNR